MSVGARCLASENACLACSFSPRLSSATPRLLKTPCPAALPPTAIESCGQHQHQHQLDVTPRRRGVYEARAPGAVPRSRACRPLETVASPSPPGAATSAAASSSCCSVAARLVRQPVVATADQQEPTGDRQQAASTQPARQARRPVQAHPPPRPASSTRAASQPHRSHCPAQAPVARPTAATSRNPAAAASTSQSALASTSSRPGGAHMRNAHLRRLHV
jgi:hypothetical protein